MDVLWALVGAQAFALWGSPVTWTEVVAFVLAVWMVVCNWRVNPLAWPLAMVSSALYALLFADYKLYGEASLQLVFIAVAVWGWWQWLRGTGDDGRALRVRHLDRRHLLAVVAFVLVAWPLLALFLDHATDSDVPWFDALPTVGSLAGQWLLGRKYVENWPAWIGVNIVSVGLFAWKGLWLTVVLYALFIVMAAVGWSRWRQLARAQAVRA
jgi:nicotinamide mononucleotide transporter